ncbi:putative G-protein coupled receptor 22 [Bagarius yarrelli]|uniref:Putative G-protein coupled receptor 22 n=1 Tax=Bagarius yarrelli TaxID=175774 RepID=A0A556TR32_BAGYA|nr:putative G-protein coupled receptor 22 [Bagarius yarrelli]
MIVSMETDGSFSEGPTLTHLQSSDGVGAGLVETEEAWLSFRATVSAILLLELLLGVGGNLTVLVLYCGHCSLLESVSHAVTLSLHTLDLLLCLLCLPITAVLLLLGGASGPHHFLLCCLHESAATFASVGTALNLLLISLDRYDISVRPANRLLTPRRAAFLLAVVWIISLTLPILPFVEVELGATDIPPVYSNSTLLCSQLVGTLQAHLFLQAPIFLCSLAVMLFTYSRILQALRIRIGHPARARRGSKQQVRRPWQRRKRSARSPDHMTNTLSVSPPPLSTEPLVASDTITTVTMNTEINTPSVNTPLSPTPTADPANTPLVGISFGAVPLTPISALSTVTTPPNHNPTASTINTTLNPTNSTTTILLIPNSTINTHLNPNATTPTITTHLNSNPNTATIIIPLTSGPNTSTIPSYINSHPPKPTQSFSPNPKPTISTSFISPKPSLSTFTTTIPPSHNPAASTITIPSYHSPSVSTITTPFMHTTSSTAPTINPSSTISTTPLSPIATHATPSVGVGASVSAILALRRAVRRHRDRRERQKRVFRMSVIIVLSFLLCWAPLSITPLLHLVIGPSDWLERLRVCFLVLAYWTVVLHPLLYAFTRQKLRKVLHTRLRRLRNKNNNTTNMVRIKQRKRRKHRTDCSDATDRCLMEAVRE